MSSHAFVFSALDTLMFRDGRPFNQGDEGASAAESVFPPPPPTLVGALRLHLARQNGFPPWPVDMLGDGVDWQAEKTQLGELRFGAPLLVRQSTSHEREVLYPVPMHLVKAMRDDKEGLTLLLPRTQYETDLGRVYLPSATEEYEGVRTLEGDFVTPAGMRAILDGGVPQPIDIVGRDSLWRSEPRVGIGRDRLSRAANSGEFYTATHTRLAEDSCIVLAVEGLDSECKFRPANQRLGGEHRAAHIDDCKPPILPAAPRSLSLRGDNVIYAAITLAPTLFKAVPGPGQIVPGLPGELVCACIGKPSMLGGWNSQSSKSSEKGLPLPMRSVLPAGSVFFMTAGSSKAAIACHGSGIGSATEWGFGQVLIARVEVQ